MTEIELTDGALIVHVRGVDKLWAFKSQLENSAHSRNRCRNRSCRSRALG